MWPLKGPGQRRLDLEDNRARGADKHFAKTHPRASGGFGADFPHRYRIYKCCNFLKHMSENNRFDESSSERPVAGCL